MSKNKYPKLAVINPDTVPAELLRETIVQVKEATAKTESLSEILDQYTSSPEESDRILEEFHQAVSIAKPETEAPVLRYQIRDERAKLVAAFRDAPHARTWRNAMCGHLKVLDVNTGETS